MSDWKPEFRNPQEAFESAIRKGKLSTVKGQARYAGNWMYMHSEKGKDYFKHCITRKYMAVEQ